MLLPMDVCAYSPAEVATFYGQALHHLTTLALLLADEAVIAPELTRAEKAEALDRLSRVVRRNALIARHPGRP